MLKFKMSQIFMAMSQIFTKIGGFLQFNHMRKSIQLVLLLLTTSLSVVGQQKLTLEEIWGGAFRTKGMDELNAMKNTNQYTVLNFDRNSKTTQIDLFDYATLNKVSTLIDTKDFKELESIDSYTFDKSEKKILLSILPKQTVKSLKKIKTFS